MRLRPILLPSSVPPAIANWLAGFATEIDFDTVASGTVVNNQYRGITLSAVPLKNAAPGANFGNVYASNLYDLSNVDTGPNVVTISQPPHSAGFGETGGGIQVTFASPQLYVSIDALPIITGNDHTNTNTNAPYMSIYGVPIPLIPPAKLVPFIATVSLLPAAANPNFQSWQTLDFVSTSPTPNIGSIIFSSSDSGVGGRVYALFDRLRFAHHLPLTGTFKEG